MKTNQILQKLSVIQKLLQKTSTIFFRVFRNKCKISDNRNNSITISRMHFFVFNTSDPTAC
jgi:hypothetical protein